MTFPSSHCVYSTHTARYRVLFCKSYLVFCYATLVREKTSYSTLQGFVLQILPRVLLCNPTTRETLVQHATGFCSANLTSCFVMKPYYARNPRTARYRVLFYKSYLVFCYATLLREKPSYSTLQGFVLQILPCVLLCNPTTRETLVQHTTGFCSANLTLCFVMQPYYARNPRTARCRAMFCKSYLVFCYETLLREKPSYSTLQGFVLQILPRVLLCNPTTRETLVQHATGFCSANLTSCFVIQPYYAKNPRTARCRALFCKSYLVVCYTTLLREKPSYSTLQGFVLQILPRVLLCNPTKRETLVQHAAGLCSSNLTLYFVMQPYYARNPRTARCRALFCKSYLVFCYTTLLHEKTLVQHATGFCYATLTSCFVMQPY